MDLGLALTIVGVLLTTIGLVALWPSISVEACPPINPAQPFSVPFKITNAGYPPIEDLKVHCYLHRIQVGGVTVTSSLQRNANWSTPRLGRGESITIISQFIVAPVLPAEADIAIVSDFKSKWLPFTKLRRYARFVGHFATPNWQWLRQPSHDVKAAAAKQMKAAITAHG
jgi:hypothetical protein